MPSTPFPALFTASAGLAASAGVASAQVAIDVPLAAGREDAAEPIRRALQSIAPFVTEGTLAQQDTVFRAVVDRIVEATPIRPLDAARAALEQRAIAALFAGTEWLTAEQLGRLRDPAVRNAHSTANRWRAEGKVFALVKGGVLYHPRYAFDETWEPRPVIAAVMAVLGAPADTQAPARATPLGTAERRPAPVAARPAAAISAFRLASWFESTNGHLDGRRPREVIADDPASVLAAAREHAHGPLHG